MYPNFVVTLFYPLITHYCCLREGGFSKWYANPPSRTTPTILQSASQSVKGGSIVCGWIFVPMTLHTAKTGGERDSFVSF